MKNFDIFISHSSKDNIFADKIVSGIEKAGYKCWIAPRDIKPGTPYARSIMEGIRSCGTFIVLITDNSVVSEDVLNEVDNAHSLRKRIIPVWLGQTKLSPELNYYLSRTQWVTADPTDLSNIADLLRLPVIETAKTEKEIPREEQKVENKAPHPKRNPEEIKAGGERNARYSYAAGLAISVLWLAISYYVEKVSDALVLFSMLVGLVYLIIMVIAIFNPGVFRFKDRKKPLVYLGIPSLLYFASSCAYIESEVAPDSNATEVIDSSDEVNVELRQGLKSTDATNKADSLFRAGDYAAAIEAYSVVARSGDGYGDYMLGKCYYNGLGTDKDFKTAFRYFTIAAEAGENDAFNSLGVCYLKGRGTSKDLEKAAENFTIAAKNGSAVAQSNLADCYVYGAGVTQSYTTAMDWYKKAAQQDYAPAAFNIGRLYYNGRPGIKQNYQEAAKWYRIAAEKGLAEAQNSIGVCYLKGHGVDRNQEIAAQWFTMAADQGNATAQYNLGNCYRDGAGVGKDKAKAKQLYLSASAKGSESAKAALKKL